MRIFSRISRTHLWREEVSKSIGHSRQRDTTEEEDDEYDVGECGGDIDDFTRGGNTLDHTHIDEDPGDHQRESDLPIEHVWRVDVF